MIREPFNLDWYFYKETGTNDPQWNGPITLPHDAMLYEKRDPHVNNSYNTGFYPGGVYHYSKRFFIPEEFRSKNVLIEFEGVYMNSQVYINHQLAGGRPYGYSNFYVSADQYLTYGHENLLEVVVRNADGPNSRWYSGSGIYREVKIMVGDLLHLLPDGVKITTKDIQPNLAIVEAHTTLVNNAKEAREIRINTQFRGVDGEVVAYSDADAFIDVGETISVKQNIPVHHPLLWSTDHPNLYSCSTKILDGDQVLDENIETFGIRLLELDAKNGLRINGEPVKLRGGCIHHDNGVIGATTLQAAEDRRIGIMKASGFNAIRSSHNPISKALLESCDRQGMLVMDEFSDIWFHSKTRFDYSQYFYDWWERDVQAMVDKDYNHPSVILYSIGNEISETAIPEGVRYSQELANKIKSLDNTRFVINCINGWLSYFTVMQQKVTRKKKTGTFHETLSDNQDKNIGAMLNPVMMLINKFMDRIVSLPGIDHCTKDAYATVDVAGYNYMAGRYKKDGIRYPSRIICGSETFPPDIAKNWRLVKRLPYLIGDFSWTGWDYLGEAGLCTWQYGGNNALFKPYPCVLADSVIVDITGHRLTQSYIHEIVWGTRTDPFIAVQPVNHTGEKLSKSLWRGTNAMDSWTWHGYEGRPAVIEVYSNAYKVELFQNGKSLGKKLVGDQRNFKALIKTIYQPGELTAIAYTEDGTEVGRSTLKTGSRQIQLHAQPEVSILKADGADLAYINIVLGDENAIVNPLADRIITVKVEGAGSLLGFGSANPFTNESFVDNVHSSYYGRALAVIRAGMHHGEVKISVSAEGCQPITLTIPVGD